MRTIFFGLVMAASFSSVGTALGQDTLVVVFGTVMEVSSREAVSDIEVNAIDLKWGRRVIGRVGGGGRYELHFLDEAEYMVEFSAPGFASKRLRLNLHGPTAEDWVGGFGMEIDITLFRELPGLDLSLFEQPMGICNYSKDSARFEWDTVHVNGMRERSLRLLEAYEEDLRSKPATTR